ncbi:hypothetical protein [Streptomyces virginiae]|uniref:hypothetical protein n=1 Tax=Streptomyces virginiae TaxID=1961 RepID=UPI0034350DA7
MTTEDPPHCFTTPRVPEVEAKVNASRRCLDLPEINVKLVYRSAKVFERAAFDPTLHVKAVIPVHWQVEGGLVAVHDDGTVATSPLGPQSQLDSILAANRSLFAHANDFLAVPTSEPPTGESVERGFLEMGWEVSPVVRAMNARNAVLSGDRAMVESFTSEVLGLWSGWHEPVSTALLGDWMMPLLEEGRLSPRALTSLKDEARTIHRQLTPVWDRKVARKRLLLLDTPLAEGMTLHDLLADRPSRELAAVDQLEDPRLLGILQQLTPGYRAVVLALGNPGVSTWAEAAALAGAPTPAVYGEKVRRKVKGLATKIGSLG